MSDVSECWLPVLGFEGYYEVSSAGRVRSVDRVVAYSTGQRRAFPQHVLKPFYARAYQYVHLTAGAGYRRKVSVHILVCEAFYGARPHPDWEARHLNGKADDNRAENLVWGTRTENRLDKQHHGTAANANTYKTECVHGHPFDEANTYYHPDGSRRSCRTCVRRHGVAYKQRRKAAAS